MNNGRLSRKQEVAPRATIELVKNLSDLAARRAFPFEYVCCACKRWMRRAQLAITERHELRVQGI